MIQPVAVRPALEKLASSAVSSSAKSSTSAAPPATSTAAPPAPPPRHRLPTGDKSVAPEASASGHASSASAQRHASGPATLNATNSAAASVAALGAGAAVAPLSRAELEEGVKRLGSSKEALARLQQELNCELVELMEQRVALEVQLETLKRRN